MVITKTCPCNIQEIFSAVKIENFAGFFFYIFLIFAQNRDCEYTLEPPRHFAYPPCIPKFCYIKVGFEGYTLHGHVFVMVVKPS